VPGKNGIRLFLYIGMVFSYAQGLRIQALILRTNPVHRWRFCPGLGRGRPPMIFYSNSKTGGGKADMLGTFVNVAAIVGGSLLGLLFGKGIPERYNRTVMQGLALAVMLVGLKGALACDAILIIIGSLVLGTLIGEWVGIEGKLDALGGLLEKRFSRNGGDGRMARAFVTTSLIFCVGSMAIVGALESGLSGNHETLFAKSALDGVAAVIFAASMGAGVLLSAFAVLIYQGGITLLAELVRPFLVPEVITEMSGVGGLLILAIGINLMDIARIRIGNMLPAIFIPLLFYGFRMLF